tara:strand:- start:178 stop:897 length:720 start_codon:yes stop_codon:yes gene_type:complete
MVDDNFYYGELNKLALSSSSLKLLLSSPKTYKYVTKYGSPETQPLRDGRLVHLCILEPRKFEALNFVNVTSKNSKAYKEAKKELSEVYTRSEKENAEKIADAFLKNEHALKTISNCAFEIPSIGIVQGFPFRGKADVITNGGKSIVDIKTTTDVKGFPYAAKKYSYDVQCYLYCKLFDISYDQFKFVVIDKGSLDIAIWKCSKEFYDKGKSKTKEAIGIFEKFFIEGQDIDNYIIEGIL